MLVLTDVGIPATIVLSLYNTADVEGVVRHVLVTDGTDGSVVVESAFWIESGERTTSHSPSTSTPFSFAPGGFADGSAGAAMPSCGPVTAVSADRAHPARVR